MRLVHADLAEFMILFVNERELVRPLQHLEPKILVNEWYGLWPALVGRARSNLAGQRDVAVLLDGFGRPRLQDRIAVVADQVVVVAGALESRLVRHRRGTGRQRLERG